jgi:hypothetical protein
VSEQRTGYRFGPLERRGLLGPIRAGQAAVLAGAALFAVIVLDFAPTIAGAVVGLALLAFAAALTTLPLGGRTAEEWAPITAVYSAKRLGGGLRFGSSLPLVGWRALTGGTGAASTPALDGDPQPPPALAGVRIGSLPYRDRGVGILSERSGRRLTAVLACRVVSFTLLDPEAQERRLARWGLVLSGAAGTAVRRIQWLERTVPARGDELARWLHAERDPTAPPRGTAMIESYLELISTSAKVTQEHELLVAVQVDSSRVRERGRDACSGALLEATERIAERLDAAEIEVVGALGPDQLSRVLRTAFDPFARAELAALEAGDPGRDGVAESGAWPLGAQERWDGYRSDGAEHATYWIGAWPRVEVSPMFMDALLGRSSVVRTVAVTFEPIPIARSTREVEAAVTRDRADRELRRRFGQSETARQAQALQATARREAELAAGHCEVRLSGFVTVSGRDRDELRRACSEVLEQAARARLELHRMYGQQAEAFTFTLPLCRGLK